MPVRVFTSIWPLEMMSMPTADYHGLSDLSYFPCVRVKSWTSLAPGDRLKLQTTPNQRSFWMLLEGLVQADHASLPCQISKIQPSFPWNRSDPLMSTHNSSTGIIAKFCPVGTALFKCSRWECSPSRSYQLPTWAKVFTCRGSRYSQHYNGCKGKVPKHHQ